MKFCYCVRLQKGVFGATFFSWMLWLAATLLYIPYILLYSPTKLDPDDALESGAVIPKDDYNAGRISAVVILFGLFVDSLLMAGIYMKYKIKSDMLIPWLIFYSVFIFALIGIGAMVAYYAMGKWKLISIAPIAMALFYSYLWVCVAALYKEGKTAKHAIMRGFTEIALQPLAQRLLVVNQDTSNTVNVNEQQKSH